MKNCNLYYSNPSPKKFSVVLILFCGFHYGFSQQWNALGPGLNSLYCSAVTDVLLDGQDLYVAGTFIDVAGNPDADYIARWDGHEWHAVGQKLNNEVMRIAINHGDLYIAGQFTDAGGDPDADYIAKWDGRKWIAIGPPLYEHIFINALAFKDNDLYVGGEFTDFGGDPDADYIVRWDGVHWHPVGSRLNSEVLSIVVYGEDIYIGGRFTNAGGLVDADRIIRWHERGWFTYPGIDYGEVNDIIVLGDDEIYVTGPTLLLKWNGHIWINVALPPYEYGYALAADSLYVYVGTYYAIHRYHRTTGLWDLYPPFQGAIWDLETDSKDLFAGGSFYNAGDISAADNIARWGAKDQQLNINGVPNLVCKGDPPFTLPVVQSGITGQWSGDGVFDNEFYPQQVANLVTLTFLPDPGQHHSEAVTTDISVFQMDSFIAWGFVPWKICESDPIHRLFEYICQPGISGRWSGPGIEDEGFNPTGLNGSIMLTYTPDYSLPTLQPLNLGQCAVPPTISVDVINFNAVEPIVNCFNNHTPLDGQDDIVTIIIDPVGNYRDTVYEVNISSGTITPNRGSYNATSFFQLQPGSAGTGDVVLTLHDLDLPHCSVDFLIHDPGGCSRAVNNNNGNVEHLHIYPNPVSTILSYEFGNQNDLHQVTVTDLTGHPIFSELSTTHRIWIKDLKEGIYVLQVDYRGERRYAKFYKK